MRTATTSSIKTCNLLDHSFELRFHSESTVYPNDTIRVSLKTVRPWTNGKDWETHETLNCAAYLRYNYNYGWWEIEYIHTTLNNKFRIWLSDLVSQLSLMANAASRLVQRGDCVVYSGYFVY